MEYLVVLAISLAFWTPAYIAAFIVVFLKRDIPKKLLFCVFCLVFSYGTIGLIAPVVILFDSISTYLVYDWTQQGRDELAYFFIKYEEIPDYIVLLFPLVASFIVPFKLAKKWEGLVEMYS